MTAGHHRGRHYTEWTGAVRDLKRDGKTQEAIALLTGLVEAVESEALATGHALAPWYTENLAILHRQNKDYAAEVAALDRFAQANAAHGGLGAKLAARHRKATDLLAAAQDADAPAACPACGTILEKPPAKAFACPHCTEQVVARRRNGQTILLRAADRDADETVQALARHREAMLRQANEVGVSDGAFTDAEQALTARFGAPASPADVFWSVANHAAIQAASHGQWSDTARAYRAMARHLVGEGRGWVDIQREAVLAELRAATWVEDSAALTVTGCDCDPCTSATPTVLTRAQALASGPPPHPQCARPPCRCWLAEDRAASRVVTVPVQVEVSAGEPSASSPGLFRRLFGRG